MLYVTSNYAQESSLSLSPSLTELVMQPGQTAKQKYKLVNKGDPTLVKLEIASFEAKDSAGGINLNRQTRGPFLFEISDQKITLGEIFFLKNNDSAEFELSIISLERATEQDYYYTLLAQSDSPKPEEEMASVRAKITLGSHLLITLDSNSQIEIKPKLAFFEITPRFSFNFLDRQINLIDSFDKIPVKLLIDNTGKNLIAPRGYVKMRSFLGSTKNFEIKPQNVLANSQKELAIEDVPFSGFFIGNHELSASINFGEGTPSLYASTSFLAIPIKLTLILTLPMFFLIFLRNRLSKKDR